MRRARDGADSSRPSRRGRDWRAARVQARKRNPPPHRAARRARPPTRFAGVSVGRDRHGQHQPGRPWPTPRLGNLQSPRQRPLARIRVRLDLDKERRLEARGAGTRSALDAAVCEYARAWAGECSGFDAARRGIVHGRISYGADCVPRFPLAGARELGGIQPFHSARRRELRPARGCAALSRPEPCG
jgi:hypothetical protein